MTVKELIGALSQYPEDADVMIWGFDHHTESLDYIENFDVNYDERIYGRKHVILE